LKNGGLLDAHRENVHWQMKLLLRFIATFGCGFYIFSVTFCEQFDCTRVRNITTVFNSLFFAIIFLMLPCLAAIAKNAIRAHTTHSEKGALF
jgi:hypothetical protein